MPGNHDSSTRSRRAGRAVRRGDPPVDYGNGMQRESIIVMALDAALRLAQRMVDFDTDEVDGAIAELDRLHTQVAS